MIWMGLDVGDATVGVAVSDGMGMLAHPVETIRRTSVKETVARIIDLVVEREVERVVVGLPMNMNGTLGPQGEKTQAFAKQLEKKLKYSDKLKGKSIPIEFWDERLTSKAADRTLIEADMRRDKRKQVIDQLAAVYILQGYLDRHRG